MQPSILVISALVLMCGCTDPPPLRASDYDQSCARNSDCVSLQVDICRNCGGTFESINFAAVEEFEEDVKATECPELTLDDVCEPDICDAAPGNIPACVDGVCTIPPDALSCDTQQTQPGEGFCRGEDPIDEP